MESRAETEYAESKETINAQHNEILRCVKEYHDKVNDPRHWEMHSLQKRVLALEWDQRLTNKAFDQVKIEKARMEEKDIPDLLETIEANGKEIKELKDAWAEQVMAQAAYTPGPTTANFGKRMFLETTAENTATSNSAHDLEVDTETKEENTEKKKYIPKHNHPAETAKREAELDKLRAKQEKRGNLKDGCDEIMGLVRKWEIADELYKNEGHKFGVELYNRNGWKQYKGQGTWDIWDGYGWYAKQGEEMKSLVDKLGEEGFLH